MSSATTRRARIRRRREQGPDEPPGLAREVAPERATNASSSSAGGHLLQRLIGVDPDDAGDPVAEPQRRPVITSPPIEVADEDDAFEAQLVDDRDGVVAEGRHRPGGAPDPQIAVAGEVDRRDEMAGANAVICSRQYARSHDQPWTKTMPGEPEPATS
jgi:hypothetical protein